MTDEIIDLIEEAESGNPVAQTSLGAKYYFGNGVRKDFEKAVKWFSLAVRRNSPEAKYFLGMCFANGEGVKKDYFTAAKLLSSSSEQGNRKAAEQLIDVLKQHRDSVLAQHAKLYARNKENDSEKKPEQVSRTEQNNHAQPVKNTDTAKQNEKTESQSHNQKTDDNYNEHMPKAARDKLDEKTDKSSKGSEGKQRKRNEAIIAFPWEASKVNKLHKADLFYIEQAMDEDLYGLDIAKRQILRYLAVHKRNPEAPLRPLLLIGPPGTGKSSFGRIIADAINKPLKVISMPSIAAGCELTGTEKHWESAGCGIIVQSILDAGEYPVFLLDEVDKAAKEAGRYSSPQHGLLNLLDDSRDNFTDVFFEVPVNLQNALFILTANDEKQVDNYLLDRCKVITVEGYKDIEDRRIILEYYMLPKLYKTYNLTSEEFRMSESILEMILAESMDPEGGLRTLQAQAESVLHEAILRLENEACGNPGCEVLTHDEVEDVLKEISAGNRASTNTIGFCIDSDM